MDTVEHPDLCEPRTDTFHHSTARLKTAAPVRFPLEQVSGKEGVGAELKDTAEFAGGGGRPEGEFLHEIDAARCDEAGELVGKTIMQWG